MNTWKIRQGGKIVDSGECEHNRKSSFCFKGYRSDDPYAYECTKESCPIKEDEMKYTPEQRKEIREKHGLSIRDAESEIKGSFSYSVVMCLEDSGTENVVLKDVAMQYDAFLAGLEQPYEFKTAVGQSAEFTIDKEPEMEETGSIKYAKNAFCIPQSYDIDQVIMYLCDKVFERTKQRDEQKKYANSLQAKIDRSDDEEDYGKCEGCGCKLEERHYADVDGVQFCAHCWIEVLCDPTCTVEEEKPEPVISREFHDKYMVSCRWGFCEDDSMSLKQYICYQVSHENTKKAFHDLKDHGAIDASLQLTGKSLVVEKPGIKVGDMVVEVATDFYGIVHELEDDKSFLVRMNDRDTLQKIDYSMIGNGIIINPRKITIEDGKITVEEQ